MKSLKSILSNVKEYRWKSIWAGDWSLLACSDWGDHYLRTLRVGGQPFLKQVIFFIRQGKSSAWADEEGVEFFSKHLMRKVNGRISEVKKMSQRLKAEAKKALLFIEQNKNYITPPVYKQYLKVIRDYYIPHVQVKYIVDALPENLLKKFLPIFQEARVFAEPVFGKTIEFDKKLAAKISEDTGIKPELTMCLTQKELAIYFKSGEVPNRKELSKRRKLSALVFMNKTSCLYVGRAASRIEKAMLCQPKVSEFKGFCAFPGQVSGRVRIVENPKEAKNFRVGDILVASMTRPEYLSLMRKAAAFVTDAGGVLSHAAIVARELKKPCIIGTKIATKVLHDGDRVEVDAEKGVVKKIKN